MESPFSLLVEKILKSTLQEYIEKDGLILDSFSLFDSNLKLKNVELKKQIKEINDISIQLLNGIIYDLNIEGSILQNKINIELSNISLCLYIPSIEKLLYSYPKSKKLKDDPCIKYSFPKNQINQIFQFLSSMSFLKLTLLNLSLNIFINIHNILLNIWINVEKCVWKTDYKENDVICSSYFDIHGINLSFNFTEITSENVIYDIINKKGDINNECHIVNNLNLKSTIIANKYRFERIDYEKITENNSDINFINFSQNNNKFIINIENASINISNLFIIKTISLIKKIQDTKQSKLNKLKSGKEKLNRIKKKFMNNKNIYKNKGFKFKNPTNSTTQTYIAILKYLTYISLIMKQKKIIDFDLNFYTCEKLISEYRFDKLKNEYFILDYLIEQNISSYINSPPISGSSSLFLNMDNFKDLKQPTENKTLKAFMFFILEKFIICKKCLDNYSSYDDYYLIQINFGSITLDLTRNIESNNYNNDDKKADDEDEPDNVYMNRIENSIRIIRENILKEYKSININEENNYYPYTNILLQLKLENFSTMIYSNMKEHFILRSQFLSLKIYNYSYIDISGDINYEGKISYKMKEKDFEINNDSFSNISQILSSEKKIENESTGDNSKNKKHNFYIIPLLKIEYDSEISLCIMNKKIKKLELIIGDIILLIDCFSFFLAYLYFLDIINSVKSPKNFFFTQKQEKDIEINDNIIPFEFFSLKMNQFIINLSTTNQTEHILLKESIVFQLNSLTIFLDNSSISFSVYEILLGSIQNSLFLNFCYYKNKLQIATTIFNMFDIEQSLHFEEIQNNKALIKLNSVIFEILKKDIDTLYTFYATFVSLYKLKPIFDDDNNIKIKQDDDSSSYEKTKKNLKAKTIINLSNFNEKYKRFCLFTIDKIIIYLRFEKLKYSEEIQDNPEKVCFKHIITIIKDINFATMKSKNNISFVFSFDSIHIFHQNQFLFKILESKIIKNEKEDDGSEKKEDNNENDKKLEEIKKYVQSYCKEKKIFLNCSIFFIMDKDNIRVNIFMPNLSIYFDYILFRSFLNFLNFQENKYINSLDKFVFEQLENIIFNNKKRYNVSNDGVIETKKNHSKLIMVGVHIDSTKFHFIEKRKVFISLLLYDLNFNFKDKKILFSSEIKTLNDEREISQKKKIILQKKRGAQKLNFTIKINFNKRNFSLIFEKARVVFLMRVINDITEYFYRILFKDIIDKTNYDKLFEKRIQDRFKEANKKEMVKEKNGKNSKDTIHKKASLKKRSSIHKGSYYLIDRRRLSKVIQMNSNHINTSHMSLNNNTIFNFNNNNNNNSSGDSFKFERNSKRHLTNINIDNSFFSLKQKETIPFTFKIIVIDSEVGICMNSLKNDELIATVSEFEFGSHLNDRLKDNYIEYFNNFKDKVYVSQQEKTFRIEKVDFYINIKDIKIKKVVDKNITNQLIKCIDIVNINSKKENKKETKENKKKKKEKRKEKAIEENTINNISIILENKNYEEILSTFKIVCIIKSMRIKLYMDVYEELMRLMFENFGEQGTIISEYSNRSQNYFDKINYFEFMNNFSLKKFLIKQDIILLNEDCIINVYNYPAKCSFHRTDRKTPKQHIIDSDCQFGKNFPDLELEKLCEMKIIDFYLLMRFFPHEKYFYVSFNDMKIDLNKNMLSFNQYPDLTLVKIENCQNNCFTLELTLGKDLPTNYDIKIYNMKFLMFPLPIISMWRFFCKYFFYYTNTKIKNVFHKINLKNSKNTIITLKNSIMLINTIFTDSVQQQQQINSLFNNIEIDFDLIMTINQTGNTVIAPFTSFLQYIVDIKGGFLNGKEDKIQFLDQVKIIIDQFSKGRESFKDNDRTCYYFIKYGDENNKLKDVLTLENSDNDLKLNNDVDVKKDYPQNYRNFIAKYKFKEEEEIGEPSFIPEDTYQIHFNSEGSSLNNDNNLDDEFNDNLRKSNNSNSIGEINKINVPKLKTQIERKNHILKSKINNSENNILYFNLNFLQIRCIIDILSKISKNYSDNAKYILHSLYIQTEFNNIIYKTAYGIYINEMDIRLCDSQFNAQLFQLLINKFMFIYNNNPNNQILNKGLVNLLERYSEKSTGLKIFMDDDEEINNKNLEKKNSNLNNNNNNNENNEEKYLFTSELLIKFLLRLNYHNSNQLNNNKNNISKFPNNSFFYDNKTNSLEDVLEADNSNDNIQFNNLSNNQKYHNLKPINEKSFWEPVIEPMPGKFTFLTSKNNKFIKFDILSLKPTFEGLNKICRQNSFHSLNINLNERLMENVNILKKDYIRIDEIMKKKELDNDVNQKKTLTVLNLTEYKMLIKENSNFKNFKEEENEINTNRKKKIYF